MSSIDRAGSPPSISSGAQSPETFLSEMSTSSLGASPTPLNSDRVTAIKELIHERPDLVPLFSSSVFVDDQIARLCIIADQIQKNANGQLTFSKIPLDNGQMRSLITWSGGKYLLLSHVKNGHDALLGVGGSKKVKGAIDLDRGCFKAVAITKEVWNEDTEKRNKFWNQISANAETECALVRECSDSENIVNVDLDFKFHSVEKDIRKHYQIMDYYNGGDLFSQIELGVIPVYYQKKWIGEIAAGLKSMHDKGILHRDIKMENILLKEDVACIADFGFACKLTDESRMRRIDGTSNHMAPEAFRGIFSIKSDAWALGVTAFQLITRGFFVPHGDFKHIVQTVMSFTQSTIDQKITAKIPEEFQPLLRGLLMIDVNQRWDMVQVLQELKKIS